MGLRQNSERTPLIVVCMVAVTTVMLDSGHAAGQVRSKQPDRGTYQSPRLQPVDVEPAGSRAESLQSESLQPARPAPAIVKPAAQLAAVPDVRAEQTEIQQAAAWSDETVVWNESTILHDETCDGCLDCDSCCDSIGCDSCGVGGHRWANSFLSFDRDRWFGSIELLLMFPKGDRLPPLVTTGPEDDPDTAGQLDQTETEILYGGDRVLEKVRAGGRVTLGTWIDQHCCRSLVMRGWYAGRDTDSFAANQSQQSVITRPFFNVTDGELPEQDTQIIAFPDRATGSISVRAASEVFGADISARQKWFSRFGGTVDVLYGYQFMRFNEDLSISSTSMSLDEDFAPVGSVLAVDDRFDAENEFHGGQFGIASRYRECGWSFHSLFKVACGSMRRGVALSGQTLISNDGATDVDPNGLLVRSTNARVEEDYTFGWVPELDLSIGWHRYPRFDVTFGYNIIAMTDAIQVSGLIDSDLAVDLSEPPNGQQRPSRRAHYRTYYTQGMHFGLQYVY